MSCQTIRVRLSAYHDGELPAEEHTTVAAHVAGCSACAEELADFAKMTALAAALPSPSPPPSIWSNIEQQLERHPADPASRRKQGYYRFSIPFRPLALAASLLVAVGLTWFSYEAWFDPGAVHHQHVAEFGEYLDEFRDDPAAAQKVLLATYEGRAIEAPEQAAAQVGYLPAISRGLPEGYVLEATYVVKMPCCTCVQAVCKRSDGSTLAIFEHAEEDSMWLAGRPTVSATCNGKGCCLVDLDDRIAASWKQDTRHITLIGVSDLEEVSRLVAWFDNSRERSKLQ